MPRFTPEVQPRSSAFTIRFLATYIVPLRSPVLWASYTVLRPHACVPLTLSAPNFSMPFRGRYVRSDQRAEERTAATAKARRSPLQREAPRPSHEFARAGVPGVGSALRQAHQGGS